MSTKIFRFWHKNRFLAKSSWPFAGIFPAVRNPQSVIDIQPVRRVSHRGPKGSIPLVFCFMVMLVAILASPLQAQSSLPPEVAIQVEQGIDHAYNMVWEEALASFGRATALLPDHPIGDFLTLSIYFWLVETNPQSKVYQQAFDTYFKRALKKSQRFLEQPGRRAEALFYLGATYGPKALMAQERGDLWRAFTYGKQCYSYLQAAVKADPGNFDAYFGLGLFEYYVAILAIPKMLRPLVDTFLSTFFDMNTRMREEGLHKLQLAAKMGTYNKIQAQFNLCQIYLRWENQYPAALVLAQSLSQRYPSNSLFRAYLARAHQGLGHLDEATALYEGIFQQIIKGEPNYQLYPTSWSLAGVPNQLCHLYLNQGRYRKVLEIADWMIQDNPQHPEWLKPWGYFRKAQAYQGLKDPELASAAFRQVLSLKDTASLHRPAIQALKHLSYPKP